MALINKLTAIGDAIRSKTGTTAELSLDDMVTAINSITSGSNGLQSVKVQSYNSTTFDISNFVEGDENFLLFFTFMSSSTGSGYLKAFYSPELAAPATVADKSTNSSGITSFVGNNALQQSGIMFLTNNAPAVTYANGKVTISGATLGYYAILFYGG